MTQDTTIQFVSLALDAAIMRQTAIATNIANVNTRGYQTIRVNFEEQIQSISQESLETIQPTYEQTDTPSSIDEQIALGVKNNTQYRALIKGLNHKLAIMALALQGPSS